MNRLRYLINRLLSNLKKGEFKEIFKKFFKTVVENNKINLDEINLKNINDLNDIFLRFWSDKGYWDGKKTYEEVILKEDNASKFKNYLDWVNRDNPNDFKYQLGTNYGSIYENLFKKFKNDKLRILEIGVANGHSLAGWYTYFPNAEVYGIDIKQKHKLFYSGSRLKYFQVDITDKNQVANFKNKNILFDIIIDDSLHDLSGYCNNLINFFPILKPGGIYSLEDYGFTDMGINAEFEFNKKNGGFMTSKFPTTMTKVFNNIKAKTYFKHSFFNEKNLEYLFNNVENIEIFNIENPGWELGVLTKINNNH